MLPQPVSARTRRAATEVQPLDSGDARSVVQQERRRPVPPLVDWSIRPTRGEVFQRLLDSTTHLLQQLFTIQRQRRAEVGGHAQWVTDRGECHRWIEQREDWHPAEAPVADGEVQEA